MRTVFQTNVIYRLLFAVVTVRKVNDKMIMVKTKQRMRPTREFDFGSMGGIKKFRFVTD